MSKPKAPAPPDYAAAAEQTGQSSLANIQAQTEANRPNQYTPWGSSTWNQDNRGNWEQNVNLHPDQQAALDAQMTLGRDRSQLAQGLTGRMQSEFGEAMDWDQLPQMGGVPTPQGYQAQSATRDVQPTDVQGQLDVSNLQGVDSATRYNQSAGDALYGRATSRLDPQWEQRSEQKDVQLRNQGLRPGDQAYDTAMENMGRERTDAYQQAGFGADIGAGQEASRMQGMDMGLRGQQFGERQGMGQFGNQAAQQQFGMNLGRAGFQNAADAQTFEQQMAAGGANFGEQMQQSNLQSQQRQAQIAEQMQRRGQSLNEMTAIMQGQQVGMPSMPSFQTAGAAQATDYLGAAGMQHQANYDQYGAQSAQANAMFNNIGSLAGGAMAFSDRRLKTNIVPIGDGWYSYKLFGHIPEIGVMADEQPQAVVTHWSGFDMVNYGNL